MSHSTSVDGDQITRLAEKHRTTAEDIKGQLQQLRNHVAETASRSTSGATTALQSTCDEWINALERNVLAHLGAMADNIVRESKNQEGTDQEANKAILNVPMITGSFLGAGA
ncbi:hypothetical protein [Lentzea sp. NPDC059081]|uniref:hypothetical protein n=1 Tax=Lentzea sp. NPDC059081 TaxID=3346719 RepID=UPI0036D00673